MPGANGFAKQRWRMGPCWVIIALAAMAGCAETLTSGPITEQVKEEPKAKETPDVVEKSENPVVTSSEPEPRPDDDEPRDPFPRKLPLPADALEGGVEWLNTAGPITIESLRGKVVLLDFWTYCCINCMHVLPDLKRLEEKYPDQLVVIGVHSAKFDTERDSQNIREAVLRYEIKHPVVNDAEMIIWRRFDVHAWPSLWMIDPQGNAVGYLSGEGVFDALDAAVGKLVAYHRMKGTLKEGPVHFELESSRTADTPLRFPGKIVADEKSDRLFISDSNHNRIVITTLAGKLIDVIGTGESGRADGPFDQATFFRPQGMALDGNMLYAADTENHMLRRIDLDARVVSTIAGTGEQGQSRSHRPQPAKDSELNSPWDLWMHAGKLYIAMAGPHQIWQWDPDSNTVRAYAGSGREDIEDGDLPFAAFAQPSGLTSDGEWLFVADSEGSSIRAVPLGPDKTVWTVVGTADLFEGRLFTFGDVDGENGKARLQHALGVAWADGVLYVADTYNNKIKAIDPEKRACATFLGDDVPGKTDDPPLFDEPSGLSAAAGKLFIADTNNHAIRTVDLKTRAVRTLELAGLAPPRSKRVQRAPEFPNARKISIAQQTLPAAIETEMRIKIELADGYELNSSAPMSYLVESVESSTLLSGDKIGSVQRLPMPATEFTIPLTTGESGKSAKLRVSLTYMQCLEGASGICEIHSVIWEIPIQITANAEPKPIELVAGPAFPPSTRSEKSKLQLESKD